MTEPIVVGVALRDDDEAPLALARDLARFTGAPLALVHVDPHGPLPPLPSMAVRERSMQGLRRAAEPLRADCEVAFHAEASSSPARGLHDAAAALDAASLIVGSSHRGALGRVMPGGVGERLLHAAPCAVALAPRGYTGAAGGIRRIGVAFVDTPEGREALAAGALLSALGDAHLSTFTVLEPPHVGPAATPGWVPTAPYDARPRLQQAEERVRAHIPVGLDAETTVMEGDAARLLAGASVNLDLLVCGSRGYGPLRTVLLGGVSGRLAHTSACPLLVLPRTPPRRSPHIVGAEPPRMPGASDIPVQLVIAYDGSDTAAGAIRAAAHLVPGADARVVYVRGEPDALEHAALARIAVPDDVLLLSAREYERQAGERASELAERGRRIAEGAGLHATAEVRAGSSPWRALCRAAEDDRTDLLVCGSRGRGPFSRAVLGSTSSSLLHHAERPVLVVPPGAGDLDGPVLVGYDDSDGARAAIAAAARIFPTRTALIVHAWSSPIRQSDVDAGSPPHGMSGLHRCGGSPPAGASAYATTAERRAPTEFKDGVVMQNSTSQQPLSRPAGSWFRRPDRAGGRHGRVLDLGRLLLGMAVVALGVVFLLDSAGVLDADRAIDQWWPLLIVAAGVLTLLERPPSIVRGTLLSGVGAVLLLFTTDVFEESAWDYVWPAVLILVGLVIVARWHGRTIPAGATAEDVVRATAIFGGPKLVSTAQALHGAWLTAIFGGITLDLRDARPAPEGASVNATAAFGGIDVLVPKGWRISVRSTPIFGGLDDKTDHSQPPPSDAPVLHIDAVTFFGGVEIKHQK